VIKGNYIGVDATGAKAFPEQQGSFGMDGGTGPTMIVGNVIAGWGTGIDGGTIIQGNWIGTDKTGSIPMANGTGIAGGGQIGGTVASAGNTIAFNTGPGIAVNGTGVRRERHLRQWPARYRPRGRGKNRRRQHERGQ
jgi:hypothetical protein